MNSTVLVPLQKERFPNPTDLKSQRTVSPAYQEIRGKKPINAGPKQFRASKNTLANSTMPEGSAAAADKQTPFLLRLLHVQYTAIISNVTKVAIHSCLRESDHGVGIEAQGPAHVQEKQHNWKATR